MASNCRHHETFVLKTLGGCHMKNWTYSILLALALAIGAGAQAQTFDESMAAYRQGNYATAIAGFRKLAERGNVSAQYNLGLIYEDGRVPKDDKQAMFWYRKAAEQGDAIAQRNLGVMYEDGQGVPKDDKQAVFWYRKAAEQGNARAQDRKSVV